MASTYIIGALLLAIIFLLLAIYNVLSDIRRYTK